MGLGPLPAPLISEPLHLTANQRLGTWSVPGSYLPHPAKLANVTTEGSAVPTGKQGACGSRRLTIFPQGQELLGRGLEPRSLRHFLFGSLASWRRRAKHLERDALCKAIARDTLNPERPLTGCRDGSIWRSTMDSSRTASDTDAQGHRSECLLAGRANLEQLKIEGQGHPYSFQGRIHMGV